jgi:predicted nucleotidyltransferase
MNLARPYAAVSPSLEGDVLVTLARSLRPMTGREVARLARRGSQAGTSRALRRLASQGIVLAEEAGRAILYSLNREHLAAPAAMILAELRNDLLTRLRTSMRRWKARPAHASLFGSAARGDGGVSSDIDLFVVRPANLTGDDERWRAQLDQLAEDVRHWTGNHLGIAEVSETDVGRLRRKQPTIVASLERDAITLHGPDVARLIRSKT